MGQRWNKFRVLWTSLICGQDTSSGKDCALTEQVHLFTPHAYRSNQSTDLSNFFKSISAGDQVEPCKSQYMAEGQVPAEERVIAIGVLFHHIVIAIGVLFHHMVIVIIPHSLTRLLAPGLRFVYYAKVDG